MAIVVNVPEFERDPVKADACLGQDYARMVEAMDALGVVFAWNVHDQPIHSELPVVTREVGELVSDEYLQVSM